MTDREGMEELGTFRLASVLTWLCLDQSVPSPVCETLGLLRWGIPSQRTGAPVDTDSATESAGHTPALGTGSSTLRYTLGLRQSRTEVTLVWKEQYRCVRKGLSQARASTLFSTMVHSTSSSISTTSFFRALMAKYSLCPFSSANSTWDEGDLSSHLQET